MEFWATAAPFSGTFAGGYQLAVYPVAPLAAGASQLNVNSGAVPYTLPPAGQWYAAMVLTEYTGSGGNGGYTVAHYVTFPTQIYGWGGTTDTTAPTASISSPTGGTVSGLTTVSVNAADNVGVTRVDLLVNGAVVATDHSAPWQFSWNSAGVPDGPAQLKAIAYDAAGNAGGSAVVTVTVANNVPPPPPADTTPPTVGIASPTGGTVSGLTTVSVSATDNVGVTRVDLLVNGAVVATDHSAPWQFSWNSAGVPDGLAQLKAVAHDAAGNAGGSAVVTVTVANNVPPPPPVDTPPPADTTPPTVGIAWPTGGTVSGVTTVSVSATDNVGVTRVDLLVNGAVVATDHAAPWQLPWNSGTLGDGPAQLSAIAYDAAGNAGGSVVVTVAVANGGGGAPPPAPAPPNTTYAIEYYHAALDHYFITMLPSEIAALDGGRFVGWARTGQAIKVHAEPNSSSSPVCRIYLPPLYGDSHFFSASPAECSEVVDRFPYFMYESGNVFYIDLPDTLTGACPGGTIPVYRVWNNRIDTNHRYTTSRAVRDHMVLSGHVAEGCGPDAVIMCAPQ
jgi:hypothetical protein